MKLPAKLTLSKPQEFLDFCDKKGEGTLAREVAKQGQIIVYTKHGDLYNTGIPGSRLFTTIGLREEELQFFTIEEI